MIWVKYLTFYWYAKTKYSVDSPFLFDFINEVLEGGRTFPEQSQIEQLRRSLYVDESPLKLELMGAGSKTIKDKRIKVKHMANSSLAKTYQAQLLYNLIRRYRPERMLELGTCFGISTLYQHFGNPGSKFISIEGRREVAQIAIKVLGKMVSDITSPQILIGQFSEYLPVALNELETLDYIFIDGDHQYESLLKYYQIIFPFLHQRSIVVIHDIYWSVGMYQAWQEITGRPEITVAIDLFHTGILFYHPDVKEKLQVKLIPARFKPLSLGFFR